MTRWNFRVRRPVLIGVLAALAGGIAWLLFAVVPGYVGKPRVGGMAAEAGATVSASGRTIQATLYYVADGAVSLVGVDREVPYAETAVEQAQRLIEAQLEPAPDPLLQAIPDGTRLRSLFISKQGEAYVDLSREITTGHPGGSLDELFTVYAIVNVLTVNLPAVASVQILVDGREVDTLAGHIDLRRPLTKNLGLVRDPES